LPLDLPQESGSETHPVRQTIHQAHLQGADGAILLATMYGQPEQDEEVALLPGPALLPQEPRSFYEETLTMFPVAFTMTLSLLFIPPAYIVMRMAYNPAVGYFSGIGPIFLIVIPFIIIGVHMVHVRKGGPSKYAVILGLMIPSILLVLISYGQYMTGKEKSEKFFSSDCNSSAEKKQLQDSWKAGYDLFLSCANSTAAYGLSTPTQLMQNFRIQDCEEYRPKGSPHRANWEYLQYLEQANSCAGWCYHGQQLWSKGPNKDSCSATVAAVYQLYVYPHAAEICFVMLAVFVFSALIAMFGSKMMRARGLAW